MNLNNKKSLPGARGKPQPFNRQAGRAPQPKPVVAQLKTAAFAQKVERPAGPPIYRPQPAPKVLLSLAQRQHAGQAARGPIATSLNRSPATSLGVQAKMGSQRMKTQPLAPPPYKPQPSPRVLQPGNIRSEASKPPGRGLLPLNPSRRPSGPMTPQLKPQSGLKTRVPDRRSFAPVKPEHPMATNKAAVQRRMPPAAPCCGPRKAHTANIVQRAITFTHGARLRQNNVAESIANMVDYGITRTTLNGRAYPGDSKENFLTAMIEPRLRVEAGSNSSVAVSVESVPVQQLGYVMELPTRGAWRLQVSAANIRVKLANQPMLEGVQIPIEPDDSSSLTLEVRGLPNNSTFSDLVESHEEVHVGDLVTAVDQILRVWDANLNRLCSARTRFEGATQSLATAKLYEAAGGTPREIAEAFVNRLRQQGMAFHQTDAGKAPSIVNIDRSGPPRNGLLEVYLKHQSALLDLHEQRLAAEEARRQRAAYDAAVSESLARPVNAPINSGSSGNRYITNDML